MHRYYLGAGTLVEFPDTQAVFPPVEISKQTRIYLSTEEVE